MTRPGRLTALVFASAVLPLGLFGCGGSEAFTPLSGKLVENGEPLKLSTEGLPPGDKPIRVGFVLRDDSAEAKDTFYATVKLEDGTFQVPRPKGSGPPPGNYRITVSRGARGTPDHYEGKYGPANSPLVLQLPSGKPTKVTLDLALGTVTVE